jgi:hypothetical protein
VDPSPISFTLFFHFTITRSVYFTCILLSFYHSICSILCSQQTSEIDNLIAVGRKVLGCVMCRFHVVASEKLHADKQLYLAPLSRVSQSYQASPSEVWLSPTGSIQPWFHKQRETCCCAPHTFLLGFLTGCLNIALSKHFSGAVAGEKENFCKGSLARTIFYFVIVLLYFIFTCIILSKIQIK